ncbi:P-loop containing nucleoside triphosphate hydrolase protein [Flagelloscypha sp. PMI_526]|nr:P-loop containing nucleoside triphosphate hydrolase protein [Flagelloscypha sp. PMI_526]
MLGIFVASGVTFRISSTVTLASRRAYSNSWNTLSRPPLRPTLALSSRFYSSAANNQIPETAKRSFFSRILPSSGQTSGASFRKIVQLAKPERVVLLQAVGLLLVSSAVTMSIPFTIGKLIDFFSSTDPVIPFGLSLWQASGALLTMFTIGAVSNAGRAFLMRMAGQRIVARLRERTYAAALRQEVEFVEKGEGDVLSRLNVDTSIVGESVTQNLSDGLRAVVMSSVGLGAMFWVSPTLTGLMMAIVPPISLGVVFYGRYIKKLSNKTQEAVGEMSKAATESLTALRTVQSYNAHPQEEAKFHERITAVLSLAHKEATASAIFFGSTGWSGNVTILCLLGYGGSLVSQGVISVGDLTSLLMYTAYVGSGLQMLTGFFTSIMRAVGAGTRIFDLLDRRPVIPYDQGIDVPAGRRGIIKFEDVHFEYPSRKGVEVLNGFDLELRVGESVAIVGSSGSGKSSVHSLLLRYYDPIQGCVTFDGEDIRTFNPKSWRSIIGVVPQDPVLFTGTIASNIAYGYPDAPREEIERAAKQANCEFVWSMPQGFDTPIGRLSLSGGQRQRLAIARALLKKPTILALDEATSALDATSENRVNNAIDKILRSKATTCLFVAHRLSTIARAERIVVLEGGKITEVGTYRELIRRPDSRFQALMAAQLNAATVQDTYQEDASETHEEVVMVQPEEQGEEAQASAEPNGTESEPATSGSRP